MPKLRHLAEPPEWRRVAKPNILLHTPDQFVTLRRQTPIRNRSEAHLQEELEGSTIQTHRTARTTSTSNTSLESLDSDSWFQISSYVPKSTILAICCTSRHLHDTLIPILYHSIDLSIHSTTAGTRFSFHYRRQTCRGQYIFLRQILRKPEYGQYVRSFMWTLGLEDEKVSFLPRFIQEERVVWKTGFVETVFGFLNKVTRLDLGSATRRSLCELNMVEEEAFPTAQHIRLSGSLGDSPILHGITKSPISILHLGPLGISGPWMSPPQFRSKHLAKPPSSKTLPNLLHPGFHSRCQSLHTLSLSFQHKTPEPAASKSSNFEEFYTSLAAFLPDIRPRSLIFTLIGEAGEPMPQPSYRYRVLESGKNRMRSRREPSHWEPSKSPFDSSQHREWFKNILLPVLEEGWKGLQTVEIRGVDWDLLNKLRALREKSVMIVGDGWENEEDSDDDLIEAGGRRWTEEEKKRMQEATTFVHPRRNGMFP